MSNGAQLENIYFFYYPAYNGLNGSYTDYPIAEDEIIINNNTGREINFYLVKQKNPAYSDTQLNTLEAHCYSPTVMANGDMIIYHNFDQNLGGASIFSPLTIGFTGSVTLMGTLYDDTLKKLMYDVEVIIYPEGSYNGSYIVGGAQPILTLNGTMLDW